MSVKNDEPIIYTLKLDDHQIEMNKFIGNKIEFSWDGIIHCISCTKKTNKSFNQGYCYPCFRKLPENSECIIKPELCRGHIGEGRDIQWEKDNHVQDHFVYLAVSSIIKVGVTRATQIPVRWIDQGASYAMKIAKTPNRYLAGCIEVALKDLYTDKTNWRKMLSNDVLQDFNLFNELPKIKSHLKKNLGQYLLSDQKLVHLDFPVKEFPVKVKSVGFDKQPRIEATLNGIKGQYLLLDQNRVLNIRKHAGYLVHMDY